MSPEYTNVHRYEAVAQEILESDTSSITGTSSRKVMRSVLWSSLRLCGLARNGFESHSITELCRPGVKPLERENV
jgi:hypothetical protein